MASGLHPMYLSYILFTSIYYMYVYRDTRNSVELAWDFVGRKCDKGLLKRGTVSSIKGTSIRRQFYFSVIWIIQQAPAQSRITFTNAINS